MNLIEVIRSRRPFRLPGESSWRANPYHELDLWIPVHFLLREDWEILEPTNEEDVP